MDVSTEQKPRWMRQGGTWIEEDDSPKSTSGPDSESSMSTAPTVLEAEVFMNILTVLRKMESKMDIQGKRLQVLEMSSRSVLGDNSIQETQFSPSLQTKEDHETDTPLLKENVEAMNYARSVLKMKWQFDDTSSFAASVHADEVNGTEGQIHELKATGDSQDQNLVLSEDRHSVSMYSADLLGSKMSLGPAQVFDSASVSKRQVSHLEYSAYPHIEEPQSIISHKDQTLSWSNPDGILFTPPPSNKPTLRRPISIAINKTKDNSSYTINIELGFHILSKIKGDAKEVWVEKKRRLDNLRYEYPVRELPGLVVGKVKGALRRDTGREGEGKKGVRIFRWRIIVAFEEPGNVGTGRDVEV